MWAGAGPPRMLCVPEWGLGITPHTHRHGIPVPGRGTQVSPQDSIVTWLLPGGTSYVRAPHRSLMSSVEKQARLFSFPKPQPARHTPECVAKLVLAEKWPFPCLSQGDNCPSLVVKGLLPDGARWARTGVLLRPPWTKTKAQGQRGQGPGARREGRSSLRFQPLNLRPCLRCRSSVLTQGQ